MLTNYLKIAFRNFTRQKAISIINIFGLSVSLAATLLLLQFISHELSFDHFHENKQRIYRLVSNVETPDGEKLVAPLTLGSLPEELRNNIPFIKEATLMDNLSFSLKYDNVTFKHINSFRADSSFFKIFSFPAIEGDPNKTLITPNAIAITQSTAKKVFGDENPMGKLLEINRRNFEITCVLKDIPSNSHIKFDLITSFLDIKDLPNYLAYRGVSFPCYFKTVKPISHEQEAKPITDLANQIFEARMAKYGINAKTNIQSLLDIHLRSKGFVFDIDGTGNISQIYLFSFIAFLLFAVAIFNFINLIIARSETRSREIGLRKVCGAEKKHIALQFLGESVLISILSVILALAMAEMLLPHFSNLVEKSITLSLLTPIKILIVIALGFVTGIIAGIYPAFFMSSFTTQRAFKGDQNKKRGLSRLQVSLVVIQFTIAIFLISSVINLYRQVSYLKGKDLGFSTQVYILDNLTPKISQNYLSLKNELEKLPNINRVSGSQSIPGRQSTLQNTYLEGQNLEKTLLIQQNRIQDGYLETMQIPVVEGRDFDPNLSSDSASFILNQTAVKRLGLENPIGVKMRVHELWGTIIGVTSDYHTRSLHSPIEPLVLTRESPIPSYIVLNISTHNLKSTIESINNAVKNFDPSWDASSRFINDYFDGEYRKEEKLNKLFMASSLLSIIIAIMGLFALASFTTVRRTKEVGIRKTLGATTPSILTLVSWDLTRWVILSSLIALPLSWLAMDNYLQNFAYRTNQELWVFAVAALIGILLALATVVGQTVKIARENPVKALRHE